MFLKAKLPIWVFITVAAIGVAVIILLIQYRSSVLDEMKLQILEDAYWIKTIPKKDEFKDWKTYRNDDFNYLIKYPPNWKFFEVPNLARPSKEVVLIGPDPKLGGMNPESGVDGTYMGIQFHYLYPNETIDQSIKSFRSVRTTYFTETKIKFSGQDAYQFVDSRDGTYDILIPYQGKLYYINSNNYNLADVQKSLATFKFIP